LNRSQDYTDRGYKDQGIKGSEYSDLKKIFMTGMDPYSEVKIASENNKITEF